MSAPNLVLREADQVMYGVLSIKAASALRAILSRQRLDDSDRDILRQAAEFLVDIADGVRIASTGTFRHGARPSRSMAALDFAEVPIDLLQIDGDRAQFFVEMADALSSAANNRLGQQRKHAAENALRFFDALHQVLQRQREQRRLIGSSARRRVAA